MVKVDCLASAAVGVAAVCLASCGSVESSDSARNSEGNDDVASAEEALSTQGVTKLVPLRVVNLLVGPTTGTAWKNRYTKVLRSVDFANVVFKPAGYQFYIRAYEAYQTPTLADLRHSEADPNDPNWQVIPVHWSQVQNEISMVLQGTPITPLPTAMWQTPDWWLFTAAQGIWARDHPEELLVWVPDFTNMGGRSFARGADFGRTVVINPAHFTEMPEALAHEIGHQLG